MDRNLHAGIVEWLVLLCPLASVILAVQYQPITIEYTWPGGFKANFIIPADKAHSKWNVTLVFDRPVHIRDMWSGTFGTQNGVKTDWFITNDGFADGLEPGKDLVVGFIVDGDEHATGKYSTFENNEKTTPSMSTPSAPHTSVKVQSTTTKAPFVTTKYNYSEVLRLSTLFFDAQRSGKLPADNPIPWRGDSAVADSDNGHDLSGGWYDGSGHVKFNFPMAYSTMVLAWGMLKFKDGYNSPGKLYMACDMIKWPLEYFLKCWVPNENTLYVQVGEGSTDYSHWERAEVMTTPRPVFKVTPQCPGSDVSASTVSALAAGYLVFTNICQDTVFANKVLSSATSLYQFAEKNRGLYSDCVMEASQFYRSSGDDDDLATAAAWMYKATNDVKYLNSSIRHYPTDKTQDFWWNDVKATASLLLYEKTKDEKYKNDIEEFMKSYMPNGSVPYTPCALAWRDQWGTSRYAANAALIGVMAAKEGINPETYTSWALSQINYLLGDNKRNFSYVVGFGKTFPLYPHHQGSSCSNARTDCDINDPYINPNKLLGALVGGPDVNDNFTDSRENYIQNSVACDFNAGFQSAVAGLVHFANMNDLRLPSLKPVC